MAIVFTFNILIPPPIRIARGTSGDFPFVVNEEDNFSVEVTVKDRTMGVSLIPPFGPTTVFTPIIVNTVVASFNLQNIQIQTFGTDKFIVSGNCLGFFFDKFYEFRLKDIDGAIIQRTTTPFDLGDNYYGVTRYKPDPNRLKYLTFTINGTIPCVLEVENDWDVSRLQMIGFVNSGEEHSINN